MFDGKLKVVGARGPKSWLHPFIKALGFMANPVSKMFRYQELGGVVPICNDTGALVIVHGSENVRAVCSDNETFNHMSNPLKFPEGHRLEPMFHGLPMLNGDMHKRHRRLMMPTMHKSVLSTYEQAIVQSTQDIMNTWTPGQHIDLSEEVTKIALRNNVKCLLGFDDFQRGEEMADTLLDLSNAVLDPMILGIQKDIPGFPYARFLKKCDKVYDILMELFAYRRSILTEDKVDLVSLLMNAVDEDGSKLTDAEIIGEMWGAFAAGHETVARAMGWGLFTLTQHPEIANEIQAAVRAGEGTEKVDQLAKETMRLFPSACMAIPRRVMKDTTLDGVQIPKGAGLVIPIVTAHRDPKVFPDPLTFHPKRWTKSFKPSVYEYFPFGAGARRCLGAPFADMQVRIVFREILKKFSFASVPAKVDYKVVTVLLHPKKTLPVKVQDASIPFGPKATIKGSYNELVNI